MNDAVATVRLVLTAQLRASGWPDSIQAGITSALEPVARIAPASWTQVAWMTLVATFCSPDEQPVEAAERLTKYLLTYQETHGRFPSLEAVQTHSAERHLKESR